MMAIIVAALALGIAAASLCSALLLLAALRDCEREKCRRGRQ